MLDLSQGIPAVLPEKKILDSSVSHAPIRPQILDDSEKLLAVSNALRYFPSDWHEELASEFLTELNEFGHIYMYRFRPDYQMYARPISEYRANTPEAAAMMLMIQNNLDPEVAQFPHELVTYGTNGSVFQNWAQYLLTMQYLSKMHEDQTLVMYSGHPLGLFPSSKDSPTAIVTNGMVIPNYSTQEDYERLNALGVSQYGQMTAGSYMYIGPQGIVHGTTITILNAARKYLDLPDNSDLGGILYLTSGLGGMSGAQAKAAVIAGAVCIIAEIDPIAATKRHNQGWLTELYDDVSKVISRAKIAVENKEAISIGYQGNVVDLLEYLVEQEITPDLASDQTSLHNPWLGGYMPQGMSLEQSRLMIMENPSGFKEEVKSTLRKHVEYVNKLVNRGTIFWDYGNAFLLESSRAGADILLPDGSFRYPSYVENIMGPMCFDYGFGPFRWVCTSGSNEDLQITDKIAADVLLELSKSCKPEVEIQYQDNIRWIEEAANHQLVVGSKARILYADEQGRMQIALAFNKAIKDGKISAPIVLGRDHHDVGGTDSPYRETANIKDGSMFTADMAIHNFVGDSFRGATWTSIHNGGGVGWGEVINGGFGMYIDGTKDSEIKIESMISWDVMNGLVRRSWARNSGAISTVKDAQETNIGLEVTIPNLADENLLNRLFDRRDDSM
ncbi:MAG: urocanate hydratase [Candidatus Thalassarchaeaceae archaeon]|nr:MAG: urocanate hydratase [Marine Group II euryarchaeote MED-G37]|tara:strand:- start:1941 stop:3956 length:2016 start_codon:yes stop_codon:yes gene_type:complete